MADTTPAEDDFAWNEYDKYPLDELIALHKRIVSTPDDELCDNFAPGTCCDECNFHDIVAELTSRLSAPITA